MPRIPVLDGFRAYAILCVVLLHLLGISGALAGKDGSPFAIATWGIAGNALDVFFILSGFLLFLPIVLRGGMGDLRAYAIGRAARLLPAYWVAIAASLVVAVLIDDFGAPPAGEVFVMAGTLQGPARMLDPTMGIGFGVNGALWMVSIIAGFYVVLPLVARSYLRHPLVGLALAAGITVAWKLAVTQNPDAFVSLAGGSPQAWLIQLIAIDQLPGWLFSFALGMTGAWAYVRLQPALGSERARRRGLVLAAVASVAFVVCAYLYGHVAAGVNAAFSGSYARRDIVLGLAYSSARAALMAAIVAGPLWLQRPFTLAPVRRLADVSYGLYLIHLPVAFAVCGALLGLSTDGSAPSVALWIAISLSLSLVYAELSRRYVERPATEWARRFTARDPRGRPGPRQTAPPAGWGAMRRPSRS